MVLFAGEIPTCECAHHTTGKGCRCRHIAAVEHALPIKSQPVGGKRIAIGMQEMACLGYKKAKYARHGWHRGEHEDRQIYRCSTCGRRFRNSPGFECH